MTNKTRTPRKKQEDETKKMTRSRKKKKKENRKKSPVYNKYHDRYENAENPHPLTHKETNLNHALYIVVK